MKKAILVLIISFVAILAACQSTVETPNQTVTPTPTATPVPTNTPTPTATPVPTSTPTPTVTPTPELSVGQTMEALRAEVLAGENLCAAAYLGYVEGDYAEFMTFLEENGSLEQFPFLKDIPEENTVLASGGEWYVIVPATESVSIIVSESVLDEITYMLVAGQELLQLKAGESVLLRGNVSDIYPSFMVTITGPGGTVINYGPGLSLRDGALNVVEGVHDFTVYAEGQLEN